VTVDAVVIQDGHVLLVERGQCPGKGLLALPGGFVEQTERIRHAMLRELHEETGLDLERDLLDAAVVASDVFDYPYRSERGRTITHAFLLELAGAELPRVRGSDDARRAFWMPLDALDPETLFDDHWHIIRTLLSRA
jgi:bifunctional NMN adenylyltransferase/nudix hydrolase